MEKTAGAAAGKVGAEQEGAGAAKVGAGGLAVLLVASMMNLMGGAAVAPALPQMSAAFPEASATEISMVITLPALAIAIVGLFVGTLADKVGKVRTLAVAAAVFTLAGLSGAVLGSIGAILVGRFVLGIGIAGITVSTTALISEYFTGRRRMQVLSLQSAAMGVGILFLEFGGGLLAELGWHMPFFIYLIGLVIFVGVALFLREPARSASTAAAVAGSDPAGEGGFPGSSDAGHGTAAAHGGAGTSDQGATHGAGAPGRGDARNVDPVGVPAHRTVVAAVAGGALAIFVLQVLAFTFPGKLPYFIEELGATSSVSGLFLGIHGTCMAAASLLQGRLAARAGRATLLFSGYAALAVCFVLLFAVPVLPVVLVAACIGGVGIGLVMPTVLQWITSVMTPGTSGRIMGCYTVCLNLGQFACSLVLAPVLAVAGSNQGLFGVFGIAAVACCAVVLLARRAISSDPLRVVSREPASALKAAAGRAGR